MGTNSSKNQDEDYKNGWQTVYRIIALILVVSMFLNLLSMLMAALGIPLNGFVVLIPFPPPFFR